MHNEWLKKRCTLLLMRLGEIWISNNYRILRLVSPIDWSQVKSMDLAKDKWYLVIANHRSWIDVFILQLVFNRKIPMLKFFVKSQLRKFPFMGFVWEALDCPFLHRERSKENAGNIARDFNVLKDACKKFKRVPVSIVNYVEGTRFTDEKHASQNSPYRHLLLPKAGGLSTVIYEMKDYISGVIDVSLLYRPSTPSFWELFSGQVKEVLVTCQLIDLPEAIKNGNYQKNEEFRILFQEWLNEIWHRKDIAMESIIRR